MNAPVVMPDQLPAVPVLGRLVTSWPTMDPAKPWRESDLTIRLPIDQALATPFDVDAHFVGYESDRRLNSSAIGTRPIVMVLFVVDVDGPDHVPAPEWRATERAKIERLNAIAPGFHAFDTRGGYRLVWRLTEPLVLDTAADASLWSELYRGWLGWLEREAGIIGDSNCADWTRLYRLPLVRRDDVDQRLPAGGDLRAGVWDWTRGREFVNAAVANSNAVRVSVIDDDEGPAEVVDPLIDRIVEVLHAAGLWDDGKQAYFLALLGWLLGKGWARSEVERLVERVPNKTGQYLGMVRRARPMGGPGAIETLLSPEAWARLDAAVNSHPNAAVKLEEWRAARDAAAAPMAAGMMATVGARAAITQPIAIAASTEATDAPARAQEGQEDEHADS